jgi:SAM-dependent methyltransferase
MMTKILSEKGFKVIGLDISFSSLCVHHAHHPKHYLIQADANFLPFSDDTFHTVVCLGVWRHFPDVERVLNEVSRILISNGNFIVGYFPPAMAGSIALKQNWWGKSLIWLYKTITQRLGYIDRADFTLEDETIEMSMKKFKSVSKVSSGLHRHLLFAQYPLKDHSALQPIIHKIENEEPLKILRCPYCVSSKKKAAHLESISSNWLICNETECDRKYPIRQSIPVLLCEEGEKWIGVSKENLPDPLLLN